LLDDVTSIAGSSFYGAANNKASIRALKGVLRMMRQYEVAPPQFNQFAASRYVDNRGWGEPLSLDEWERWRLLANHDE